MNFSWCILICIVNKYIYIYIKLILKKEGDAIARDGRLQNAGADACVSRKKRKKKQIRIWADMHVAQVSTFGGRPFFCVHKYAEESVCVPWGTEGEHANPGVVRRSSGLGSLMRVVCGGRRSFRGQGGRD